MAMVASYEDVRKQRMEENKQKMEALGLVGLAQGLKPAAAKRSTPVKRPARVVERVVEEARRSSRLGGRPAVSYRDQVDVVSGEMRMRISGRGRQPLARRYLSDAARMAAIDAAEEVYQGIQNPAFVKPMLHSHTASGFWLGLPAMFCKEFLPLRDERLTLEDEEALEWECLYLAHKVGLSGGWRGFSLDHELVDGDCLIFELTEPRRFKVRIFRCEEDYEEVIVDDATEKKPKVMKYHKDAPDSAKGRKLSTFTRRPDLEEESPSKKSEDEDGVKKAVKNEGEDDVKEEDGVKNEVKNEGEDDAARPVKRQRVKKTKEKDDVVELDSDEEKVVPEKPLTQTVIRAFGRITRSSLAKALPKKE